MRRRLLVIACLAASLPACGGGASLAGVAPMDEPLPRLAGRTLDREPLVASEYADGDVLVINVWSVACAPCRREQPQLVELARAYEGEGVRFLGINYQNDLDAARGWVQEYGVPYPSLHDRAGRTAALLGYPFLPDTFVVDRGGTIRWVVFGETDAEELSRLIEDVLA